jgi:hypothetical protein
MKIAADAWRLTAMALFLVLAGCTPGERAAERADEAAPAAEPAVADEGEAAPREAAAEEPEAGEPGVDEESEEGEAAVPRTVPEGPGAVAPAAGSEARAMRNWVLLEFARPVEEADLEWLATNGFRVDSVMSELLVRGWLESSEGGAVIASDPRIARVQAQMR